MKERTTPTTEEFNTYLALNPKASNQDIADHFGIAKSTAASIKSKIKHGKRREFSDGQPVLFKKALKPENGDEDFANTENTVLTNTEPKTKQKAEDIIKARTEAFKGIIKKDSQTEAKEVLGEFEKEMHKMIWTARGKVPEKKAPQTHHTVSKKQS